MGIGKAADASVEDTCTTGTVTGAHASEFPGRPAMFLLEGSVLNVVGLLRCKRPLGGLKNEGQRKVELQSFLIASFFDNASLE